MFIVLLFLETGRCVVYQKNFIKFERYKHTKTLHIFILHINHGHYRLMKYIYMQIYVYGKVLFKRKCIPMGNNTFITPLFLKIGRCIVYQ